MARALHLFEGFGVELEYMIVDAASLDVRPITDRVLYEVAGGYVAEHELGELAWSNELALHVIELKTNGPAASLAPLAALFQEHVARINALLEPWGARLMPTAMHPWMNPRRELELWPHEYNAVYETFNRIFDCRGHGWANVQSVHLNLPFADDEEFGRLHAAVRLLLPILPALAASSPAMDGQWTGLADSRLEAYRHHCDEVPSLVGHVVPEPVFTRADYEEQIFARLFRDIAPYDPQGVLAHEWLNARGAIARFERNTIEIRVLDVQECPAADLTICQAIVDVLQALVAEKWTDTAQQQSLATQPLAHVLSDTTRDADEAVIDQPVYLAQFGLPPKPIKARELWAGVLQQVDGSTSRDPALAILLSTGSLSRRIQRAVNERGASLADVYRQLCECLAEGRMFSA
ncbi:MAG: glutamate--cysteine ligase [Planctomycetota bacterium]|nr:MAG: glutamate--cysteine ligase [Planctomycetota bacterium]